MNEPIEKKRIVSFWEMTLKTAITIATLFFDWCDDKNLVIFALVIFGTISLITTPETSNELIKNITSGLLGMAIGKGLSK